jgi:hypothetical protein
LRQTRGELPDQRRRGLAPARQKSRMSAATPRPPGTGFLDTARCE